MTTTTTKSAEAPAMPIADRLEHCAKFTGLDAVRELLIEAAAAVRKRDAVVKLLEGELQDRAQATQAELTDAQIIAAYLAWCKTNGTPASFARAILALRPERVPMTDSALSERARIVDLIEDRACKHNGPHLLTLELNQLADVIKSGLGWLEYERYKHHDTTTQTKKENG